MQAPQAFGLFFMIGGAAFVFSGAQMALRRRSLLRRAVPVTGHITRLVESYSDERVTTRPAVTYTVAGADHEFRFLEGFPEGRWHVGDKVNLLYDSAEPGVAMWADSHWGDLILCVFLGTVAFAAGAGLYFLLVAKPGHPLP